MASFLTDNDDLRFYVEKAIDWHALAEVTEYGFRTQGGFSTKEEATQFYREVLASMGELVAEELAPRAAQFDREDTHLENGEAIEGPAMKAAFAAIKAADLHRLCLPRELGGLNAPILAYFLGGEMIARADVSAMTHFSFHGGMAMAMLVYSITEGTTEVDLKEGKIVKTRFGEEMEEIARGDAWGCMDITEPNAGSDMAALRSRGELEGDQWYVTGQKIFITSGHGKWHFVIARTEESTSSMGLDGLSMFLVERKAPYVTLERVEEKLGHHGSVTAALSFDRAPARLIGERGEGFKYMLVLMNNARLGVGFESIGLAECAYRMAKDYAEGRRSMGKAIARHEMIADYLDEMETDVKALRALAVTAAFSEEIAQKLGIFERFLSVATEDEKRRVKHELPYHRARSRRLTPLLKYLAAEKAVEIARRNLQIHGGVGYTKEYGAEKLLRDALVLPIYEGTSQIQSLMAMKDTLMGILKRPQAFATKIAQARWRSLSAKDPLERRVSKLQSLSLSAQQFLLTRTATDKLKSVPPKEWIKLLKTEWDPKRDFSLAMLHAERLTRLLADEAIAEVLLEQARKFPERREILERFLDRVELKAKMLHEEITTTGARILSLGAPQIEAAAE